MTHENHICDAPNPVTTPASLERVWCDAVTKPAISRRNVSKSVRFDVVSRDGFRCRYCGRDQASGAVLHVDHVMPVSKGGVNTSDNLVTACSDCSLGKAAKVVDPIGQCNVVHAPKTFGLSFLKDGGCQWQFVVDEVSDHTARLTTFSWLDGSDYSVQHVSREFLRDQCILFASHTVFLEQANYWGDAFADRRNRRFIAEVS